MFKKQNPLKPENIQHSTPKCGHALDGSPPFADFGFSTCSWRPFACKNSAVSGGKKFRLGVLGSGKGSNMAAIADACAAGEMRAQIAIVLSDVATSGILEHARQRNLPARFIPPGNFRTKLDET